MSATVSGTCALLDETDRLTDILPNCGMWHVASVKSRIPHTDIMHCLSMLAISAAQGCIAQVPRRDCPRQADSHSQPTLTSASCCHNVVSLAARYSAYISQQLPQPPKGYLCTTHSCLSPESRAGILTSALLPSTTELRPQAAFTDCICLLRAGTASNRSPTNP